MATQLEALCEKLNIRCASVYVGRVTGDWAGAAQYKVTLYMAGRQLTVPFYMGVAHTRGPSAADVLYCLASDAQAGDLSFEDFCSDFGYDSDSRKAEQTWKACVRMAPRVRRFLGEHFDAVWSAEH